MKSINQLLVGKPPLFIENYYATQRVIVNQGGTSSGKTYTINDVLFTHAMTRPRSVITVVGQDIPNLKVGAFRDAKNLLADSEYLQQWFTKINESDRVFHCINGSLIEYNSYDGEQDAKSGKRDYLFINEANGIPYPVYWQLAQRTRKKIYLDYNPTSRFWAHDELIGKDDVKLIISDHRHNPFISEEEHTRIENISDPELHKVYARGLTGKIQGLVYTNWQLCDTLPETHKNRWIGIDFGFTNDPTAIVDVRLSQGQLWIDEIEYKTRLTNPDIAQVLKTNGIDSSMQIIADSAEPKSIQELRNFGFNVEPSQKGADSIKIGIDILQRYKLNITRRSKNIRKELLAYKWKQNNDGQPVNEPVDHFNHALDPIRYIALNKLAQTRKTTGIQKITYK